jgi:hypothetical protein
MLTAQEFFEKQAAKYCRNIPVWSFNYSINISYKYKYLYFETPKVACTTIKATLQRMELEHLESDCIHPKCIHDRDFSPLLKPSQIHWFPEFIDRPDVFKFCFVRNPYTRMLSAYLDKMVAQERKIKRVVLDALQKENAPLSEIVTFDEFVGVVCDQDIAGMNPHWRVQYHHTCQDTIKYDFVGRFENFASDFALAMSRVSSDYEHYSVSRNRHATQANELLESYYTPNLQKKVAAKFDKDFEHFGYSKDLIVPVGN